MKPEATNTSIEFKRDGITVLIRPTIKDGVERFVLDYRVKGARKLVWRSTLADARKAASDAIAKIVAGQTEVLSLTNTDAHVYLRAREYADGIGEPLDHVARDHVEAKRLLAGRVTVLEACRDWLARNSKTLPKITVPAAVELLKEAAKTDGKSHNRRKQLAHVLDRFARDMNCQVDALTPDLVSKYLTALPVGERSKRNHRDVLGFFSRWLVLRGYLPKGMDLLEGVQKYSARKMGEIEIYRPEEIAKLIEKSDDGMLPFIVIQAFAGLRHAEVARLDWSEIELSKKRGDSFIEVRAAKSKTGERRLVPVQDNLKRWLMDHRQERGEVCQYANTTKQLLKIAADAGVHWKHNGLRHSFISYRVAATADVPRVADEAGNSVQVIRQHYLRRVKPAEATRWFSITPAGDKTKIVQMTKAA